MLAGHIRSYTGVILGLHIGVRAYGPQFVERDFAPVGCRILKEARNLTWD